MIVILRRNPEHWHSGHSQAVQSLGQFDNGDGFKNRVIGPCEQSWLLASNNGDGSCRQFLNGRSVAGKRSTESFPVRGSKRGPLTSEGGNRFHRIRLRVKLSKTGPVGNVVEEERRHRRQA